MTQENRPKGSLASYVFYSLTERANIKTQIMNHKWVGMVVQPHRMMACNLTKFYIYNDLHETRH